MAQFHRTIVHRAFPASESTPSDTPIPMTTQPLNHLQLDVKGCKDCYDSFRKYVEFETMDGDNQYKTDSFGLQVRSEVEGRRGWRRV